MLKYRCDRCGKELTYPFKDDGSCGQVLCFACWKATTNVIAILKKSDDTKEKTNETEQD